MIQGAVLGSRPQPLGQGLDFFRNDFLHVPGKVKGVGPAVSRLAYFFQKASGADLDEIGNRHGCSLQDCCHGPGVGRCDGVDGFLKR